VVFCYVKDYTRVTAKFKDDTGEEMSEPKYPGYIRQIVVCNQGRLVLEDVPNPNINPNLEEEHQQMTYLYDKFPFTRVSSLQETTSPWAPSDYEQLEGLQKEINKSLSQFNMARNKAAGSNIINPLTSGVPNEHFNNFGAVLNPNHANHGISILQAQAINKDSMLSVDLYKSFFFLVSGTFELEQADKTGKQVIAHKAIAALLERAATMMRGKDRAYGKLIRERGRMYLSHAMNFYTDERWISFQESGETKHLPLKGIEMVLPVKVMVVAGSTMPVSKIQQREEAIGLAQMNRIDDQALYEALDLPDRRNMIKRRQMGPIGMYLEKLKAILPPQIMQQLAMVAQMEPDDFRKALEKGEIHPIQLPDQQPTPDQLKAIMEIKTMQAEFMTKQAEAQKKIAEAEKAAASKALIVEQITTERTKQQVAIIGTELDKENMKLKRAEVLAELEKGEAEIEGGIEDRINKTLEIGLKHAGGAQGPYREKGMKSNNKEVLD